VAVVGCVPVRIPFRILPAGRLPFDVAGIGENSLDLLAVVAEHPASDTKQRLQRFARQPGGQIATALVACARLGWKTRYIGRFGDDDFGARSRESLVREGVDVTAAISVPGTTNQFAIILVDARSGARTVLWDRHPGLTISAGDIAEDVVTSARMLLVDCHEPGAAAQAARYARRALVPTVVDVEAAGPGVLDVLQQIDCVICAESFPAAFTGHQELGRALEALARESRAPFVCVTLGAAGSLAFCGGREIRTRGFPVHCIDSTGAGDVFRGAFVAGCLRAPDGDIEDVLGYANAAAALNCRGLGARGALPGPEEVDQLLLARQAL
jgi:sulfofructose kinase